MVRVRAEPEVVWESAFYLKEGDAITTWAFSVQQVSWCAAGSDSSLSHSSRAGMVVLRSLRWQQRRLRPFAFADARVEHLHGQN